MEDSIVKTIAAEIGGYLTANKKTFGWLAEQLGITENTLRNKRDGRSDWSFREILRLSELLGKTPSQLAGLK